MRSLTSNDVAREKRRSSRLARGRLCHMLPVSRPFMLCQVSLPAPPLLSVTSVNSLRLSLIFPFSLFLQFFLEPHLLSSY